MPTVQAHTLRKVKHQKIQERNVLQEYNTQETLKPPRNWQKRKEMFGEKLKWLED
jgi:hypothetical protein